MTNIKDNFLNQELSATDQFFANMQDECDKETSLINFFEKMISRETFTQFLVDDNEFPESSLILEFDNQTQVSHDNNYNESIVDQNKYKQELQEAFIKGKELSLLILNNDLSDAQRVKMLNEEETIITKMIELTESLLKNRQ